MLSLLTPYSLPPTSISTWFGSDGWMTNIFKLDPSWGLSSKLHACMSNCIFDNSTWLSQRRLTCNMAQTDVLSPRGAPALLPVFPLSVSDGTNHPVTQTTDLWGILNAFLLFTPVSNPSPSSLDIINWVSFQSIYFPPHSLTPVSQLFLSLILTAAAASSFTLSLSN